MNAGLTIRPFEERKMIEMIKELRKETGANIGECRKALMAAGGDASEARKVLAVQMQATAANLSHQIASVPVIEAYVHHNGSVGALAKLATQTDFVARTKEVKDLARDVAMQVAATGTVTNALLNEPWIKNPALTVGQRVAQVSAQVGEKIVVRKVTRIK